MNYITGGGHMLGGVYNPQYRVHIEDAQGIKETSEIIRSSIQAVATAREFAAMGFHVVIESMNTGFWHEVTV